MPDKTARKILQCKIALSARALRTGEDSRLSLREAVTAINEKFKTPATRRAAYGGRTIECRGYKVDGEVLGIYLVGYVPEDKIGIVPHAADGLDLLGPPENADFLDGEIIALIADKVTIVCRLGLFENALNAYVEGLGPASNLDKDDASFLFKNQTDIDKIELIREDGVAVIRFDGVASQAAVDAINEAQNKSLVDKVLGTVWRDVKALAHAENDIDIESENLKVEVVLKYDKRDGTKIDQKTLVDVAEAVLDEEHGFYIETMSGRQIRPENVLMNKKVDLPRYGKSVAFADAFEALLTYYKEIATPGDEGNENA